MSVDLDAADLIDSLSTGTYTVTRRAAATNDGHGRAVAGSTSTLTITASVQPASGRDLMRLPEGRRTIETRVVYTTTRLLTGGQGAANEADLLTIDGASYEVEQVQTWPGAVGYYRCIVQARAT